MKRVVTADEMRQYEQALFAGGLATGEELMERAGSYVADVVRTRLPDAAVCVLSGGGNNGGDGFVTLRLLHERGMRAYAVLLADPDRLRGDALLNFNRARQTGCEINYALHPAHLERADVFVDALFGTGLARPLSGVYAQAVEAVARCGKPVVAVDMPSGVDATTGEILGVAPHAACTVTFAFHKRGQLLFPGRAYCGETIVCPLMPDETVSEGPVMLLTEQDVLQSLPERPQDSHKGKNGRALLCVGSGRYTGAALLSSAAALRVGCGLLETAVPMAVKGAFSALPEVCCTAVGNGETWDAEAISQAAERLTGKDAVGIGCGMGACENASLLSAAIESGVPLVIDADGLNLLAQTPHLLGKLHSNVVLTPHVGEMARLCGCENTDILADPIAAAQGAAQRWHCTVLLKGATTCVAHESRVVLNTTGNAGLAKGGSGDVLTGLITGLMAQKLTPNDAAMVGAWLLGVSADMAFSILGNRMLVASDVIDAVRATVGALA